MTHRDQTTHTRHADHTNEEPIEAAAQARQEVALPGSAHSAPAQHTSQMQGHGGHAGHSEDMFKRPFWISLLLTIPILHYAPLFENLLGYTAPQFPGAQYLGLLLGSVVYWYGGWAFLSGAVSEIRARARDDDPGGAGDHHGLCL